MTTHMTIVIKMPSNEEEVAKVQAALEVLFPYQTAMSLEDEMTVLDFIEEQT